MTLISIIMPVYNGEPYLQECLDSILAQDLKDPELKVTLQLEFSVYDDGSLDRTPKILEEFKAKSLGQGFRYIGSRNPVPEPKGVGYGRNQAIRQSSGEYLCFCDADDVMDPRRVVTQYLLASSDKHALIGSAFKRLPQDSTPILTSWANGLSQDQLYTQIFLSFGPPLVMPTWFCARTVYDRVPGGFDESGKGTPEDLLFFYKHLDAGGSLLRCPQSLMVYRYHAQATSFSISEETIWAIRLNRLESTILEKWESFSIWNAGKTGRRFFRSLTPSNKAKVVSFIDIDEKKLRQGFYEPHPNPDGNKVPILSPHDAKTRPPFVICVKTEHIFKEDGSFRKILDSLSLAEGTDYVYFN